MPALKRFVVITLSALLVALLTARLGWWQLERAAQKTALQASIDARRRMAPVDAPALARDVTAALQQHHRPVQLTGHWANARTVFLDNRQMRGRPGFYVVTPLLLADGRAVLVQRGWAPRHADDRERVPDLPGSETAVEVRGHLAPPPARLFALDRVDGGRIRQNLDLDAFARDTGLPLAPLSVLQSDPATPPDGLLRDWPVPLLGVSKHHGYAFQWFALSALVISLYVWFQFIQARRSRRR